MYCVRCGVRLPDGTERCPLCDTPVWNPEGSNAATPTFSDRYPTPPKSRRYPILAFLTALILAACLSVLIICLSIHHALDWSGYVIFGCALFYFAIVFPFWFERREPLIFVPMAFFLTSGYLLYICLHTGGKWFLSFAFPLTMLVGVFATASVALFRFSKARLRNTGLLLIAIGCSTMLVELFQHITFGGEMFAWSLYPVSAFSAVGLFLFLCGIIPPWRAYLERKLFL